MMANRDVPGESNSQTRDADNSAFVELVRTLDNAYQNAVTHQAANRDSETADLLLENASIRLSSRMLSAMTQNSCHLDDTGTVGADTVKCALDDESVHLRDLTDMLSYAADRLQQLATSMGTPDTTREIARISSLEHLYRMTFAISKAHFDPSQCGVYFEAARQQLRLARQSIQTESKLCACTSKGLGVRLGELSKVDHLLSQLDTHNPRH